MVPGDDDERDPRVPEPGDGLEGGEVGPGPGPHRLEEVTGMDEGIRAEGHDGIDGGEKVFIDEALPHVPAVLVQAAELREAQMAVTDMDESHLSPARVPPLRI